MITRLKLDSFLESQKPTLKELLGQMQAWAGERFYVSIWMEKRQKLSYTKNKLSQNINDSSTTGLVFRVYDGQSLFEEACNEFDPDKLKTICLELMNRVDLLSDSKNCDYKAASWDQRLQLKVEEEIVSQIPKEVNQDTWVHFGTPMRNEIFKTDKETSNWLTKQFDQLTSQFESTEVDFLSTMVSLQQDHFLFLDPEVCLSQSLQRNMGRLMASRGDKTARVDRGGLGGQESFAFQNEDFEKCRHQLADLQTADELQPGRYKLIMGPGITGVFAHEAFGHTQEGDTWARGRSKAKILFEKNERVGNEQASILNNPAVFDNGLEPCGAWGSYYFDEEGWFSQEQVLVDKGELRFPMTHLLSSQQLNIPRTANGKRENWKRGIYTRQTNTYFSPGDKKLEELIGQVDYGFLAEECAGGMEDPKGMGIQVGILYVKEIKDGKLTGRSFQGPGGGSLQMTGSVQEYLNNIVAKTQIDPSGQESAKHPFNEVGGCAKYHKEVVYAGCGGPYMLVDDVLLG